MTEAVFDFASIGKLARLKDTPPQDAVTAGVAPAVAVEPAEGWHVYWQENLYGKPEPPDYWAGHGRRWVQDASGKWVTEEAGDNDLSAAG